MISMIAAVGKNNELGKDNGLIWRIPNDMKFFKNTTMGHKVVMGRKTYESLPSTGLPGREMIVLSRSNVDIFPNAKVVSNIGDVIDRYKDIDEEIFIIGGANIYKQFIDVANSLYLTEIDREDKDADVYFPEFDKDNWDYKLIETDCYNDIKYKIYKYVRKDN